MAETLTRQAYDRLVEELDELTTRGRIEIAKVIEAARALGDLSENGDYHAAKDTQGKMEARIRQIQAILRDAIVVDEASDFDEVAVGCIVTLRYMGDEDLETYFFGSIEEKRPGLASLSPSSPLGQALIGRRAGSVVAYQAPGGQLEVEIVEVGA
ncbi:MAG: transcription elongation factor GreA [Actinomycetota bacterium]|nr:transcription elongation factor GreA [Actinomycetota bacterium]MDA8208756.1 transcription elongation factor GreA [Actinomycetota bacterium]